MKTFSTTWKHIRRSPYQAFAAILIMMLTFLAITVFSFLTLGSARVIQYFESKPQVTGFFKDEAKQQDIDAVISQIKASGKASSVKFVSKEDALKIYRAQNKDDPLLLDLVTADILPASVEVQATRIEDLSSIADMLHSSQAVNEVIYQKDVVATLTTWTNAIRRVGLAVIGVLAMVSVFIMATIIGFKISQKREEIEIMRLLSATNWYIRWPFLFEGMFYAIFGAVLGWLFSSLALVYATPFLNSSILKGIPLLPISPVALLELLLAELMVAIFLGAVSSFLAVLRYLK